MLVKTLKTYFNQELLGYYPEKEIHSFFYLLSEHILKMKRIDISVRGYEVVLSKKQQRFENAIKRLKAYEPIQYIIGKTSFFDLELKVDSSVLIPRPETEELVHWVINDLETESDTNNILDIGTGSGCISIALDTNLPNAKVSALDISEKALSIAKSNALLNDAKVDFYECDILNVESYQNKFKTSQFDIIVSNPPYVRDQEKQDIEDNVLKYEPHIALFVEDDNALQFYQAIINFANVFLNEKGWIYFEINENLGEDMVKLLENANYNYVRLKKDLFGKERMIKAQKI